MMRVRIVGRTVQWSNDPFPYPPQWGGFHLARANRDLQLKIVSMLRTMPKKWDHNKGRWWKIWRLPEVKGSWG